MAAWTTRKIQMKYFRKSILAASLSAAFWAVHGAAQAESRVVDINLQDTSTATQGNTDTSGDSPVDKGDGKGDGKGDDGKGDGKGDDGKGDDQGGGKGDTSNTVPEPASLALVALALAGLAALPKRKSVQQPSAEPGD